MEAVRELRPELDQLRERHGSDQQRFNQEMLALYSRNGVTPLSGCTTSLIQLPVMMGMYRIIRGLTAHDAVTGEAEPRYVDHGSALYRELHERGGEMVSWGIDLSRSALSPHGSLVEAVPYFALAALVVAAALWQRQLAGARREGGGEARRLWRVMPAVTAVLALSMPAGVTLYYLTANAFRVVQQHLLGRHSDGTV